MTYHTDDSERLCPQGSCCGCGLCAAVCPAGAISFSPDHEGFAYPFIDESKCRRCGKCHAMCPAKRQVDEHRLIKTFGAFNNNFETRMHSGSGGIFGALAADVLERGGLVCGAAFDEAFHLRHICIDRPEELPPLLGSKYLQSDMSGVFQPLAQAVGEGRPTLFVGTPCQVAAMHNYLGDADNLLLVSIVCQGVSSPKVFDKYLQELEASQGAKASSVNFRNKAAGWMDYSLQVCFEDGSTYRQPFFQDPYLRLSMNRLFNRPCCENCFAKCEANPADIIIGDFWSVQIYIRKYRNRDRFGFSVVLTSNDKGFEAIKRLKKQGAISYTKTSMRGMITYNPAIFVAQPHHPKRDEFFAMVDACTVKDLDEQLLPEVDRVSALPHRMIDIFRRQK